MEQRFFSVIVPTCNRPGQLTDCLRSLTLLDYPHDNFEVIVVDDGSETPPTDVVTSFCRRLQVTLLTQDNTGPAAARNAGVVRARGKFIAFIDDDCAPARNWLKVLSARFVASPTQAVAGRIINALPDNPFATTTHIVLDMVYSYYNADPHHARFAISSNMALPTEMFRSLGGFNETFRASEDRDLCDRLLHRGYRLIYAPEALVYHTHPLTFRGYWRRYFNYGRGAFRFQRARAQRGSGSFRPELKFYSHVLSSLLEMLVKAQNHHDLYPALLLVMWQVANAAGFLWENRLINIKASPLIY